MLLESIPRRARWLLLALRAANGHRLSPVQLQKSLFVFGQRRAESVGSDYYRFRAYHYGPFDAAVYSDAEYLAAHGLVAIEGVGGTGGLRTYELTASGAELAERIASASDAEGVKYLESVVDWTQRLSFSDLVRAVYEAFPEMRVNSVFHDPA